MTDHETRIPVYTSAAPPRPSTEELRSRVPGWGVDLDPMDRPSYPKERSLPTGAHWDLPEQQEETYPRERSIEHQMLTPVFGTSVPLKGLSGRIRRYAYERFSEARTVHWLLLIAGDRVDAVENHLRSLLSTRPDNPISETGVKAELTYGGLAARRKSSRADVRHHWLDPILVGGPWVVAAGAGVAAVRAVVHGVTR